MSEVATKKRKRTGKQREEAKKAAIAKAAAEAAGEAAEPEVAEEDQSASVEVAESQPATEATAETVAPAVTEDSKPSADFEKLNKRIPTALKKLHQLLKAAKREESQRIIKKIKFLSKKGASSEVEDLEAQLKLLGRVDLHVLSANFLKLKLKKHYLLKHSGIPSEVDEKIGGGQTVKASGSSATPALIAKVENRLCSAKNVAEGVKGIVSWGLSEPGSTLNFEKLKNKDKKGVKSQPDSDSEDEDEASEGDDERELVPEAELDSDDEVVVQEKAAEAAGWESGDLEGESDEDEDDSQEEEDEDGDGWESGSVDGVGGGEDAWIASASESEGEVPDYAAFVKQKRVASSSASESASGSDSDSSSGSSVAVERPPAKKAKAEPAAKTKVDKKADKPAKKEARAPVKADGSSMFLPSLAAGFTRGGDSDSDPDMDYDPDGVIGSKAAPRKNRRGQRARQAIWEKKYGKNAKHIVKQREEEKKKTQKKEGGRNGGFVPPTRDTGYKQYRSAPESAPVLAKPGGTFGSSAPARSAPVDTGRSGGDGGDEKKGKNHPSWEAARRRKEAEQKLKDAPKATKIVFD